jgi:hypothetical protein
MKIRAEKLQIGWKATLPEARTKARAKAKAKDPALAKYRLERGTLEFSYGPEVCL